MTAHARARWMTAKSPLCRNGAEKSPSISRARGLLPSLGHLGKRGLTRRLSQRRQDVTDTHGSKHRGDEGDWKPPCSGLGT